MTVQYFLSASLIALFFVSLFRRFFFSGLKFVLLAICAAGLYFVWAPQQLTEIAHAIGVGRGADLIIYGVAIVVIMVAISSNIQGRAQEEKITALVRAIAIQNAAKDSRGASPDASPDEGRAATPLADKSD